MSQPSRSTPSGRHVRSDEALADDARRRLRDEGIVPIEPDARIAVMLAPGERVISMRRDVSVERRKDNLDPEQRLRGDLYVTTRRLVYLGTVPVDVPLGEISEAVVANGALRLVVGCGRGIEIRTGDPQPAARRGRCRPDGRGRVDSASDRRTRGRTGPAEP